MSNVHSLVFNNGENANKDQTPIGKSQQTNKPRKETKAHKKQLAVDALPPHGILYFDNLTVSIEDLLYEREKANPTGEEKSNPTHKDPFKFLSDLKVKRETNSLRWKDLYKLELALARLLPDERLAREVWHLRLRYRDIVGLAEYEAYLASKPPDLEGSSKKSNDQDKPSEIGALRADMEYLLGKIYLQYALIPVTDALHKRNSNRVTYSIIGGLFVIILTGIIYYFLTLKGSLQINRPTASVNHSLALPSGAFLLVLFFGAMGGLLSMQQRFMSTSRDGDPIMNVSELSQSSIRLFTPAFNGALFALLLYVLVRGKLLDGSLFPAFTDHADSQEIGKSIKTFLNERPSTSIDYAKLIIWSFIAGFAERFVPDTLSRFISSKDAIGKAKT
ncbi:hypothetical protein V9K67_08800 [Paraflavisolibacter sp. H34]|uniref:hypothetical protein n=1 Tax=Huijunlia imazamoxiresistens TaxID=3127457 RepID=UPI0030191011